MAKYSNQFVLECREAIYEGLSFDEFYYDRANTSLSRKVAQKAWNRANYMCDHEEELNRFLINDIRSRFGGFAKAIQDYYQEGFGYKDLADALCISCAAISEIVHGSEG